VPSPEPRRILNLRAVKALLEHGMVVVCAGGGGIPVAPADNGEMQGVEAVIDKDLVSALLARQIEADMLLIATDVAAVQLDWGLPTQRAIRSASPAALRGLPFAAGSIGPKVSAACAFAEATGRPAVIGHLEDADRFSSHEAGTWVSLQETGIRC
jgi:carbamate kinase